jgi:site-specific recombinase XerD
MERSVYIPHAFTDEELSAFFKASDRLPSLPNSLTVRMRRVVVPVFFRLLYSSGIRTCEARHLCVDDVDLSQGVVNVKKSKGHAQHYIVLHDTMTELLRKYDQTISAIRPKRVSFFPSPRGSFLSNTWVVYNFNNLWQKSISPNATAYGLRHNYAVKNINEWIGGGSEVFSKLVYLSKSMGHLSLESTKGYCHLVPIMSNILLDLTGDGFDSIVPEVCDEKSYR